MSTVYEAWLAGNGRTLPAAWQSKQLVRAVTGWGIAGGVSWATDDVWRTWGAFRPAYCQLLPWQALLLQKLLLSLPPGFSTLWQLAQLASNCVRCSDNQVVLWCEVGLVARCVSGSAVMVSPGLADRRNAVAQVALQANCLVIAAQVLAVMAAEAAGRIGVADIVRMRVPVDDMNGNWVL